MTSPDTPVFAAFIEKPGWAGLSRREVVGLANLIDVRVGVEALHLTEIESHEVESTAIGFVTLDVAGDEHRMDLLAEAARSIMGDLDAATADGFHDLDLDGLSCRMYLSTALPES